MKITAENTKGNKIKIYADGEFLFTVPAVIWYSSRFRDGDEVQADELDELKNQGEFSLAFDSAMRILSIRAHSEFELQQKLCRKFSFPATENALLKLRNLGLLDDGKYAALLAQELYERKGFAPKRILIELKNKGISSENAENAINSLDIDKEIGIIKIIEKYKIDENSTKKEKDRVIRRLLNMGYSFSDISKYIHFYE